MRLSNGDRVCIVGGGPAGSFAALHLVHFARQQGLQLDIKVFEPRDFFKSGPGGCNRCAGILSTRLLRGLEWLGLSLPEEVIQANLRTYAVHLDGEVFRLEQPYPQRGIVSVYRGGGPRLLTGEPPASFDGYLLRQAINHGAQLVPNRVRKVVWEGQPIIHTANERFPADLMVLATGVNSRPPLAPHFGYRPPQTAVMAQDEVLRPPTWPADQVSVFFKQPVGLIFGAVIPKGSYLNISLLGREFTRDSIDDFIDAQRLGDVLHSPQSLCGCTPRISVSSARGYFGTRWVTVGDATVTRLYKDGIGSAFFTAKTAMQVAVQHGISHLAFQKRYAPFCRRIAIDNQYGRLLFLLLSLTLRSPALIRAWRNTIRAEAADTKDQRAHIRLLWGMFTGDDLYSDLFWLSISPAAMVELARNLRTSKLRRPA